MSLMTMRGVVAILVFSAASDCGIGGVQSSAPASGRHFCFLNAVKIGS